MPRLSVLCLAASLAWTAHAAEPERAIVGATLLNPDAAPLADSVVLVRDGRIVAAGRAGEIGIPEGAERIDAAGKWLIPGLVDAHVHFFQSGGLYTRPDALDLREVVPYEQEVAGVKANLDDAFRRTLRSGITTVVDFGGPMWNFEVRRRAQASASAPRVAIAGPLVSTWKPPIIADIDDPPIIAAASAQEARELVRAQLPSKPDFIKIWFVVQQGESPAQHLPVVAAAIDEAHAHGLRVAVHATELETAHAAVEAGADVLVHGVFDAPVDEAFVALLKSRGTTYVPTLGVMEGYDRIFVRKPGLTDEERGWGSPDAVASFADLERISTDLLPGYLPQLWAQDLQPRRAKIAQQNLKTLSDAGALVATGTDAGNIGTLHGASYVRELQLMAEAGLSPARILADSTLGGARLLGLAEEAGTIAPGKRADLVILDADPLADIGNFGRIHAVMKAGALWPADAILADSHEQARHRNPDAFASAADPANQPEAVVQRQLEAYNAGDVDAFLATYDPDIELFNFPGERHTQGLDAMRATYGKLFEANPGLHAEIRKRIVRGRYVIDHEAISGTAQGLTFEAIAIYEVRGGQIRRVWFIQ